jgi:hypothetical protein
MLDKLDKLEKLDKLDEVVRLGKKPNLTTISYCDH